MNRESADRSKTDRWGLDLRSSQSLAAARVPQNGLCWWCRARPANSAEHKYKATDLRRMAELDSRGKPEPRSLYRDGSTYSGELRSLARGTAIQWSKSMCKDCNGGRDRHMDAAYDTFSTHVWTKQDELAKAATLDWGKLFGTDWQAEARNIARYYAKQVGCLFTQQSLPVPDGIIRFMDGEDRADDFAFTLVRDPGRRALHNHAVRHNIDARGYWLPPSSASLTPDGKQIATQGSRTSRISASSGSTLTPREGCPVHPFGTPVRLRSSS